MRTRMGALGWWRKETHASNNPHPKYRETDDMIYEWMNVLDDRWLGLIQYIRHKCRFLLYIYVCMYVCMYVSIINAGEVFDSNNL